VRTVLLVSVSVALVVLVVAELFVLVVLMS